MQYSYEYKYDESGNLTTKVERTEGIDSYWVNEYDKSGNLTKKIKYDSTGSAIDNLTWKAEEYEYDRSGNKTKAAYYNPDGSAFDWWEYEYDESGNCIKESEYCGTMQ